MYKIGIDVGGTNTDAVILDPNNQVVSAVKSPTTKDIETGIYNVLEKVLGQSSISYQDISYVMLGTTHATNAVIERKGLAKIAVIRICLPAGQAIEPFFTWEESLKEATGTDYYYIHGGSEFDGKPLHEQAILKEECLKVLNEIKEKKIESIAVVSIFSPVVADYEEQFAELAREVLGEDFPITLSSEIGNLGLLERENSAALNATLVKVSSKIASGLEKVLTKYGIDAAIYFTQNDGTLMSLEYAQKYPILTIGSGPTNSIRGAAYLGGNENCIVCDIGGTTTDIGILIKGFPRESSVAVDIGGVKTNFRMPDIISIGIGGGSIVHVEGDEVIVGPDSVGYQILEKAIAFGGDTLTATDCLLASGLATIDHPQCDIERLAMVDKLVIDSAINYMNAQVEYAVDRIKTSSEPIPVVLVGGGAILVQGDIKGAKEVIRPQHAGCANAIGSAIAQVSGEIDKTFKASGKRREDIMREVRNEVYQKTLEAGADSKTIEIINIEEIPIAYVSSDVIRIKAKAAGDLMKKNEEVII